jgi:hypothetical protein
MIRTFTTETAADLDAEVNAFLAVREDKTIRNVRLHFSTNTASKLVYNSDEHIPVTAYHVMAEYDEIPQAKR